MFIKDIIVTKEAEHHITKHKVNNRVRKERSRIIFSYDCKRWHKIRKGFIQEEGGVIYNEEAKNKDN